MKPRIIALFSCLVFPVMAGAAVIEEINAIRQAAGLADLSHSDELEAAASAHAQYLARNVQLGAGVVSSAHEQSRGRPEFTGRLASDRAQHFAYPHVQVTENVSLGNSSMGESISSLMSAIYHRFAFLDMQIDEIGAAEINQRFVFNMGRTDLTQACISQPIEAQAGHSYNCMGHKMKATAYEALCADLPPGSRYQAPYANRCPNGALLNRDFMQRFCQSPPEGALLKGAGRYFDMCNNGTRISAHWFERLCQSGQAQAIYQHSGSYYEMCSPAVRVHGDWYENFCQNLSPEMRDTDSGSYYDICSNDFRLKAEYLEKLDGEALDKSPEAVLWPADGMSNIQPVFYDEDPHPTPDLPMTGYPVSIQFNPQKVEAVSIMGFILERKDASQSNGWKELSGIRLIDQSTDINRSFTAHQFAWFPLQRLDWETQYRYRVDALIDGVFKRYSAQFSTTRLPVPMYVMEDGMRELTVKENDFILYKKPDQYDAEPFKSVGLRYRGRPYVDIDVIDSNTVQLSVGGSGCQPVELGTRMNDKIFIHFCQNNSLRKLFWN